MIEAGGTPQQRVLRGTLDRLVQAAPDWTHNGPVLLLVGDVVGRGSAAEPKEDDTALADVLSQ